MTPWAAGTSSTAVPSTEFPLLRPCFLHCLPTLSPTLHTSFCRICVLGAAFPFSLHKGCWGPPGLLGLLVGCSELGEGFLESNVCLHWPHVLLVAPTRHGCPKFLFPLLLWRYDPDKLVVGPSYGHRATSRQGVWPPWQMQQRVAPSHPPEDKRVHPKPTGDAQIS